MYKFTFLLLFCLISLKIDAALSIVQTKSAVHVLNELDKKPILSLPLDNYDFIEFGQQALEIDEKLGSYKLHQDVLFTSKRSQLLNIQQLDEVTIILDFSCRYRKQDFLFTVTLEQKTESNGATQLSLQGDFPVELNFVNFNFFNTSTAVFGGGIQFSHCNLIGQNFPLIVEENGIGRGDKGPSFLAKLIGAAGNAHTSYAPMTSFLSSNKTHYVLNSGNQNVLWNADFSMHHKFSFQANFVSPGSLGKLYVELNNLEPLAQVGLNNTSNAKQEIFIPQAWMNSYILGVQGGKEKVNQLIKNLKAHDIQLGAIWIQDWVGKRQTAIGSRLQWDWRPNLEYYPDMKAWIDSLHEENIKVLGYINPYFVEGGQQTIEGIENNYFVKDETGASYQFKAGGFNAYMVDLSNSAARTWVKNIIKEEILANGFDGWMCDFGEWLPFSGITLKEDALSNFYHNEFPEAWTSLNWEAVSDFIEDKDKSRNDYFIFNRSWYSENKQRPNIMWLGDQMGNFGKNDGLASAVNAYNSASLSGFPIIHSDIGGYTAIKLGPFKYLRDDEVLKRWIEMEAFTPLWRSHEGLKPDQMSQIYQGEEMMTFFAGFDQIHQDLMQTHFALAYKELETKGIPLVRHPFLMFPEDVNTYDLQYQFFVGPKLLVCPVVEEAAKTVEAYLPEGSWRHYFTKELFQGGQFYIFEAPIGQPAVFEKM